MIPMVRKACVPFCTNGVDLVNEDDTGCVLFCDTEELSDEFWTISEIFLNKFRSNNTQEGCRCLVCNSLGK